MSDDTLPPADEPVVQQQQQQVVEVNHAPGLVIDDEPGMLADNGPDDELGFGSPAPSDEPAAAAASESGEDAEDFRRPLLPDATNVRQDYQISYPRDDNKGRYLERIFMPAGRPQDLNDAIAAAPNVRIDDTSTSQEWARSLHGGFEAAMVGDAFGSSVMRTDALWCQNVQSEAGVLEAKAPEHGTSSGVVMTGERAILRMRHFMGMGSVFQIPLWHSGFWIALKAPSDSALLELDRRIMMEKIFLGRDTHGLVFSNHSVYIVGWLTDFVLSHVYDTSVDGWAADDLGKRIDSRDIPTLIWGMTCLIWTRGFNYSQACAAVPEKCNHKTEERLDVTKLHWTDNRAFTPWQVGHMAQRNVKVKPEAVEKYQQEFTRGRSRHCKLSETISVLLKSATIDQYLDSGNRWVGAIVNMVDRAFKLEPDNEERNAIIDEQGKSTTMRQFAHYVQEIHLPNRNRIIEPDTIEMALSELSSDPALVEKFMNEVGSFINDSTISLIAIPQHDCPKCGTPHKAPFHRFPNLLPIDIGATFFGLLVQKVAMIRGR